MSMDNFHMTGIEAEARRYCDRHDIRDYETYQRVMHGFRYEAFRQEIETFIRQKVRIEGLRMLGHIKVNADGSLGETVRKPLPRSLEEALMLWDEQIILSAQRWGFDSSPLRRNERTLDGHS